MKTKIRYSKLLQIGLLLTFFLPFFPQGCEPTKKATEAPRADSTIVATDTLRQDSNQLTQGKGQQGTLKTTVTGNVADSKDRKQAADEDDALSTKLSNKSAILKFVLRPNGNYTGLATLIDCFSFLRYGYGLGFAFILWLIALIIKLKDYNNIFYLINIGGLIFLFGTYSMNNLMSDERLWGFWVCIIWSAIMIVYDSIVLLKIRKVRIE